MPDGYILWPMPSLPDIRRHGGVYVCAVLCPWVAHCSQAQDEDPGEDSGFPARRLLCVSVLWGLCAVSARQGGQICQTDGRSASAQRWPLGGRCAAPCDDCTEWELHCLELHFLDLHCLGTAIMFGTYLFGNWNA